MIRSTASVTTWADTEPAACEKARALFCDYFGRPDFVITDLDAHAMMQMSGTVATWEVRASAELRIPADPSCT